MTPMRTKTLGNIVLDNLFIPVTYFIYKSLSIRILWRWFNEVSRLNLEFLSERPNKFSCEFLAQPKSIDGSNELETITITKPILYNYYSYPELFLFDSDFCTFRFTDPWSMFYSKVQIFIFNAPSIVLISLSELDLVWLISDLARLDIGILADISSSLVSPKFKDI